MSAHPANTSEEQLRQAIQAVNHGGIDADGSTDTDRIMQLIEADRKQLYTALEAALPKKSYKHLRWCQLQYENACNCGMARRNETINQSRTALRTVFNMKEPDTDEDGDPVQHTTWRKQPSEQEKLKKEE